MSDYEETGSFWDHPGAEGLSVKDRIELAGSRAEAARRAAFSYATRSLTGDAAQISLPVAMRNASDPAFAFMLYFAAADAEAGDYVIYEPALVVRVDYQSLEPLGHQTLREPVDTEKEAPLCYRLPARARAMPAAQIDRLQSEFMRCSDRLVELFAGAEPQPGDGETVARWDQLFRFLAPAELFPYYRRLNPSFFEWLATQTGHAELEQIHAAPEVPAEAEAAPRGLPDRIESLRILGDLPPGDAWRLPSEVVAAGLAELDLVPMPHSPLATLSGTVPDESQPLEARITGWPDPAWRTALATLCNPGWKIERVYGDDAWSAATQIYVGRDPDEVIWVRYERLDGDHLIAFPDGPEPFKDAIMERLGVTSVTDADPGVQVLMPDEFAVVLAAADADAGAGDPTWGGIAPYISPVALPPGVASMSATSGGLNEAGDSDASGRDVAGLSEPGADSLDLDALAASLGRPAAFFGLHTTEYARDGSAALAGFAAVRSRGRLWLWEAADDWEPDAQGAAPPIHFYQVTGRELGVVLDAFLGAGDNAGEAPL